MITFSVSVFGYFGEVAAHYLLDTGLKLNVHDTFRRRPGPLLTSSKRLVYVQFTYCTQGVSGKTEIIDNIGTKEVNLKVVGRI